MRPMQFTSIENGPLGLWISTLSGEMSMRKKGRAREVEGWRVRLDGRGNITFSAVRGITKLILREGFVVDSWEMRLMGLEERRLVI